MTRILVTGANGQLGSELREIAKREEKNLNFFFSDLPDLDITDKASVEAILREKECRFIVNCAAYTNVDRAEEEPALASKINCDGVRSLAEAAKACACTLIHVSTDYVFNGTQRTPYTEKDPTSPLGVYGRTKLAGEEAMRATGCNGIIIRTAWLYSAFGKNFVKTMLRLADERDTIRVVNDQRGAPTYAADLAAAIVRIIPQLIAHPERGEIYHYSDAGELSWFDFATAIMQQAGKTCRVEPISSAEYPSPTERPAYSVLSKEKIMRRFGVEVPDWRESLDKCLQRLK